MKLTVEGSELHYGASLFSLAYQVYHGSHPRLRVIFTSLNSACVCQHTISIDGHGETRHEQQLWNDQNWNVLWK